MVKCVACAKFMSGKDGVTCPKCSTSTHRECFGVFPVGAPINSKWRCGDCHPKMPKGRHPGTPIMQDIILPTDGADPECETVSLDAFVCILVEMRAQFESMKADLLLEFQSFKGGLQEIQSTLGELKTDQTTTKTDLTVQVCFHLENYLVDKKNTVTVSELEQTVLGLKLSLNDSEQEGLLHDLELVGLPEQRGENLSNIVPLLATNIGVTLDEREVLQKDTTLNVRPRKVVIRFSSRITRDTCLRRARECRGLTSTDLGLWRAARATVYQRVVDLIEPAAVRQGKRGMSPPPMEILLEQERSYILAQRRCLAGNSNLCRRRLNKNN
ncbi:Zinc finger DNA binding protein [Operophtera brumata]|uniref:Zinc finger DNA binding protein n=1 Tax=Operophtera brumata TaxID=104452 RepID=A0A0L7KXQ5_OPEBR|nr:Zinc finger DNA binding protein [Operophtera brumata]